MNCRLFLCHLILSGLFLSLPAQNNLRPISLADTQSIIEANSGMRSLLNHDLDSAFSSLTQIDYTLQELKSRYGFRSFSIELDHIFHKCVYFDHIGKFNLALPLIEKTLEATKLTGLDDKRAKLYNLAGCIYMDSGNYPQARKHFMTGLSLNMTLPTKFGILNNLGTLESQNSKVIEALKYHQEALAIQDSIRIKNINISGATNYLFTIASLTNIGNCFRLIDSFALADTYYNKAIDLLAVHPDDYYKAGVYYQYSNLFFQQERMEEGFHWLDSAMILAKSSRNIVFLTDSYLNYAEIKLKQKYEDEEIESYLVAAKELIDANELGTIEWYLELRADLAYKRGENKLAKKYLNSLIDTATSQKNGYYIMIGLTKLSEILESEGNTDEALTYFKKFHTISDSLKTIKEREAIDNIKLEIDLAKSQSEKQQVEQALTFEIKQSKQRLFFLGIAIFAILLILGALWIIVKQRNKTLLKSKTIDHQNTQLKQLFQERQTFIRLISHDLRNPLMQIQLNAGSLKYNLSTMEVDEEVLAQVQEIDTASASIDKLSRKILESSLLEQHNYQEHQTVISLNQQLAIAWEANQKNAAYKKIKIEVFPLAADQFIKSNAEAVQLIINNLLSNAIKYSPSQSTIELGLYTDRKAFIFRVKDQGPGFQEADFENLFKQFHPLSASPTGGESSLGIGLYLSQKLASQIGAEIEIENNPRGGAIAHLVLSPNASDK